MVLYRIGEQAMFRSSNARTTNERTWMKNRCQVSSLQESCACMTCMFNPLTQRDAFRDFENRELPDQDLVCLNLLMEI